MESVGKGKEESGAEWDGLKQNIKHVGIDPACFIFYIQYQWMGMDGQGSDGKEAERNIIP